MLALGKHINYLRHFVAQLRISSPWKYKVPLLVSFPYFFLAQGVLATQKANEGFIAALVTIIGFAGIGYLTNDWSDREEDQIVGKENPTIGWKKWRFLGFLSIFLLMALLPWMYLPFDKYSLLLIGLELLLFVLYAFKPFRFKERGILGVVTDSLYAHTVPAVLASYTFHLFTGKVYNYFYEYIAIIIVWQFLSGVRNILYHQIVDYNNDEGSETRTFARFLGLNKALRFKNRVVLPLEFAAFGVFLWWLSQSIPFVWLVAGVGMLVGGILFLRNRKHSSIPRYKQITNFFLDDLYINYIPFIFLIAMIFVKTEVSFILAIHLIVFRNAVKSLIIEVMDWLRGTKLFQWVFGFENYFKGLLLHAFIMMVYIGVFATVYYLLNGRVNDKEWFFWVQKILGRILVAVILGHAMLVVLARREQTFKTIKGFFVEIGSPYNLAIFRIFIFTVITGSFFTEVFGHFKSWTYLGDSHRVDLPLVSWFTDMLPINPEVYSFVSVVGLVLAILILVGLKTRLALILYVPVALYLWGVPTFFGKLNHHHIMVWVPIILMFSRCADVLSIDYLLDKYIRKKREPEPGVEYALPLKFIWITVAIIYCCSGFHKIWDAGLHWMFSDNLRNQILLEWVEHYDQVKAIRIDLYPILLRFFAVGVVMMEILFPLLILKPNLRPLAFLSSWGLHLSAGYFLMIDFVHLRLVNLSFINWIGINKIISRKSEGSLSKQGEYDWSFDLSKLLKMPLMFVVVPLVSLNLLFGILQINSWPFSSYPAYSNVVKDEVTVLRLVPVTHAGEELDLLKIGKTTGFRWENLRPFEERIMEKYNSEDTAGLQLQLEQYWKLWSTKVEGLNDVENVDVFYETTSIIPEKRNLTLDEGFLGTVRIKHEE